MLRSGPVLAPATSAIRQAFLALLVGGAGIALSPILVRLSEVEAIVA